MVGCRRLTDERYSRVFFFSSSFSLTPSSAVTLTPLCPPTPPPTPQIPSAGQLMEALRVKMKERKVLTEELATLATAAAVSEKA